MGIYCFAPAGFEGSLVEVETDIRRGIPGLEIVGLPDGAVREARDRVRVAVKNSGFTFPRDRILVNLSPADIRKAGSGFDLPIALSILNESGQVHLDGDFLVLGELQLSARIRPVRGVLSAVAAGMAAGVRRMIVPAGNLREARSLRYGQIAGASDLAKAAEVLRSGIEDERNSTQGGADADAVPVSARGIDFSDIRGHAFLKRALTIAAAGRHNALLFGPPGSGKTLAAERLFSILPKLTRDQSIEVSRIYSVSGLLGENAGLIQFPPVRTPHHTATAEGMIGGGNIIRPGEISLAHAGVLILDEVPEYRRNVLQALREPIETGEVHIVRAHSSYWFPAEFQLLVTANPCPCGNLGRDEAVCICTRYEIEKYWKKLGGALLDRIDLRIPVKPVSPEELLGSAGRSSGDMLAEVTGARNVQRRRFDAGGSPWNGRMDAAQVAEFCRLDGETTAAFAHAVRSVSLSGRACHSILKVARTIADIEGTPSIRLQHIYEAVQLRRYGDGDFFWC